MVHLYNSEFFNTKVTQFDNDHIQIDFSSIIYERGKKNEENLLQSNKSDLQSSRSSSLTSSSDQDLIFSDRSYFSASRTKRGVYSVARSNHWDWFVTFTFDNNIINRSDFDLCKKKFAKFWNNLKRTFPTLKYLFIVEMHSNLQGFHYHGVISGLPDNEFTYFRKVRGSFNKHLNKYNYYPAWTFNRYKLGFNSCTKIEDQGKVLTYCCKYITKTAFLQNRLSEKFKHLYFHTNNLNKPDIKRLCINTEKIDIYKFIEDNYPDFEVVYNKLNKCSYNNSWIDYIQLVRKKI